MKRLRSHFRGNAKLQRSLPLAIFIIIFAALGVYFLVSSHAASPYASIYADRGTLAGGATSIADSTASDGSKIVLKPSAPGGGTATSNCYPHPGACGYPDPAYANVGSTTACSSLPASGDVTANTNGQTIQNLNVTGQIDVNADNVTINNVCVTDNANGDVNNGPAVQFEGNGDQINNSTVHGANATNQSVEIAIGGSGSASHDYFYDCGECVHDGPWTVNDSYINVNGDPYSGGYSGTSPKGDEDHHEDAYLSDSSITMNHDTLFNTFDETAIVFGDTNGGGGGSCDNHITVTNSLLAGSGYSFYVCSAASSVGSSKMDIASNRFARCLTTPFKETSGGNWICSGTGSNGADSHGIYPYGGSYGTNSYTYCGSSGQIWSANVWDDDDSAVSC